MHPLYFALPVPYVPVRVTRGGVIAHRYTGFCIDTQNLAVSPNFCALNALSLWNDLSDPVFDGVGLAGFKSRANASVLA